MLLPTPREAAPAGVEVARSAPARASMAATRPDSQRTARGGPPRCGKVGKDWVSGVTETSRQPTPWAAVSGSRPGRCSSATGPGKCGCHPHLRGNGRGRALGRAVPCRLGGEAVSPRACPTKPLVDRKCRVRTWRNPPIRTGRSRLGSHLWQTMCPSPRRHESSPIRHMRRAISPELACGVGRRVLSWFVETGSGR